LYIEAEGDEAAAWSESERAIKLASSVYGADIHKAFAGLDSQVFPWILAGCSVDKLWMQSEVQWPQGSSVPKPAGRELHFAVDCDAQELIKVQDALAEVLQGFHEQVSRQLKRDTARWSVPGPVPVSRAERMQVRQKQKSEANKQALSKDPSSLKSKTWDPATGQYIDEDLPADLQELLGIKITSAKPAKTNVKEDITQEENKKMGNSCHLQQEVANENLKSCGVIVFQPAQ